MSRLNAIVPAAEAAYVRLLMIGDYAGRHTPQGQAELANLRDAIAECRDKDPQEVQELAESVACLAKLGEKP
jgi:hypothetical protein